MQTKKWRYATATAFREVDHDIGMVTITGVITPAVSLAFMLDKGAWIGRTPLNALVVRYPSTVYLDPEEMEMNMCVAISQHRSLEAPAALVVSPEHLEVFTVYSLLMAERGLCRAAFVDLDRATAWARRQAAIHAGWEELMFARRQLPKSEPEALHTNAASPQGQSEGHQTRKPAPVPGH